MQFSIFLTFGKTKVTIESVARNNIFLRSGIILQKNRLDTLSADIPMTAQYTRRGRTLLWTPKDHVQEENESFRKNTSVPQPMCPMHINQSESIRLDYELRRWIGGESDQDNWIIPKDGKLNAKLLGKLLTSPETVQKKPKNRNNLPRKSKSEILGRTSSAISNALEVFSPILQEHASLFEALGRRDDTFYVVWFTGEHLLLPASSKNSTGRPKMSLVLPALPINGKGLFNISFAVSIENKKKVYEIKSIYFQKRFPRLRIT